MTKIYSYNNGSKSARALADALGVKIIKHEGKLLNMKEQPVINWGCSNITRDMKNVGYVYNHPVRVASAVNKLTAFQVMQGQVSIPEWTESRVEAIQWLGEGSDVVIRHKLTGHSGEGIEIARLENDDGVPPAPLYTKYIKKQHEYRVHVFGDQVFFVQQKKRKLDVPDDEVNWQVRNHQNGFIYANQDIEVSEAITNEAKKAILALGLDFGAVDIIVTKQGVPYVLECNTACGMEGVTLDKYVEQFQKALQ